MKKCSRESIQNGCIGKHGGLANSQRPGSNVLVYSMGNRPMEMAFHYPTPHEHITQSRESYITCPSFTMEYGNGYISVLDDVDDVMMLHEVYFVGENNDAGAVRIAWVMRLLDNDQNFYASTSTLVADNADNNGEMSQDMPRGVFT